MIIPPGSRYAARFAIHGSPPVDSAPACLPTQIVVSHKCERLVIFPLRLQVSARAPRAPTGPDAFALVACLRQTGGEFTSPSVCALQGHDTVVPVRALVNNFTPTPLFFGCEANKGL